VLVEDISKTDAGVRDYLMSHKSKLMKRKIRKFDENNWFEWGALRNIGVVRALTGKPCVYVKTLTRKEIVCFSGYVVMFSSTLLCVIPKTEMERKSIELLVNLINSTRNNYVLGGRYKMGHHQLGKMMLVI
jgi:adenine-specific DNA-methyltransferase